MSGPSAEQLCLEWTSSAEASPARTYPLQASALASEVLAAACGLNTGASFQSFARSGWWSKTSPAARLRGLTRSLRGWDSSAMRCYRSRLRLRMLALRTSALGSFSSLPTLTAKANLLAPSMQKWLAHRRLLPTLSAASYGSNQGGAAGRVGKLRDSLESMARKGTLMPTLCARDERGPSPARRTQGSRNLPLEAGGHLCPMFCEWFMGFPQGWTSVMPARGSKRLVTPSSRSAQRSSGTSSGS